MKKSWIVLKVESSFGDTFVKLNHTSPSWTVQYIPNQWKHRSIFRQCHSRTWVASASFQLFATVLSFWPLRFAHSILNIRGSSTHSVTRLASSASVPTRYSDYSAETRVKTQLFQNKKIIYTWPFNYSTTPADMADPAPCTKVIKQPPRLQSGGAQRNGF